MVSTGFPITKIKTILGLSRQFQDYQEQIFKTFKNYLYREPFRLTKPIKIFNQHFDKVRKNQDIDQIIQYIYRQYQNISTNFEILR